MACVALECSYSTYFWTVRWEIHEDTSPVVHMYRLISLERKSDVEGTPEISPRCINASALETVEACSSMGSLGQIYRGGG